MMGNRSAVAALSPALQRIVTIMALSILTTSFIFLISDNDSLTVSSDRIYRRQLLQSDDMSNKSRRKIRMQRRRKKKRQARKALLDTNEEGNRLVHVTSPYHDRHNTGSFAPLNVNQWAALVSTATARDNYNHQVSKEDETRLFDSVILVCAILEVDLLVLNDILSRYCDHVVVLPRSTDTVYPNQQLDALPFVQDIIDAGRSVVADDDEDEGEYYLMFTNSDICPSENLYQFTEETLRRRPGGEAFQINRMTIPTKSLEWPPTTVYNDPFEVKHNAAMNIMQQSRDVLKSGVGEKHPGTDCFVFRSTVLDKINFGDLFLGYPPWSSNARLLLRTYARGYFAVKSNKRGTFHIGDARKWSHINANMNISAWNNLYEKESKNVMGCPTFKFKGHLRLARKDIHSLQQMINCGKLFQSDKVQ